MSELSIDDIIKQANEIKKENNNNDLGKTRVINKDTSSNNVAPTTEKTQIVNIKNSNKNINSSDKTVVVSIEQIKNDLKNADSNIKSRTSNFYINDEENKPKSETKIIDRPNTIKNKSRYNAATDLQEVPVILSVDDLDKTRLTNPKENTKNDLKKDSDYDENSQIVLDGFEDNIKVKTIDENIAEKQLKNRREEKVNKFRLFSPDDLENDNDNIAKKDKLDIKNISEKLENSKISIKSTTKLTAVLTIVIGCLTVFAGSSYLPSFLLNDKPYYILLTILYLVVIAINYKTLLHGFNFKKTLKTDSFIGILSVVVFIHTLILTFNENLVIDNGYSYALTASVALLLNNLGKYALLTRVSYNLDLIDSLDNIHTIEPILNQVDAGIIGRNLLTGELNIKTSLKTDNPTSFIDIATSDEPSDNISKKILPISIVLNLILLIVLSFVTSSFNVALNIVICSFCLSTPVAGLLLTNLSLISFSKSLDSSKALVNGFEGARISDDTNAIVFEALDLFGPRSCEIHGFRTFNGGKPDDILLKTASVIIKTKSPLTYVFNEVVAGNKAILPEVDSVVYEDKLGASGWIYKKKILVGTRDLLIHHGVTVPTIEYEKKYTRKNRKILYVAESGKLMAMFVVSYNAHPKLKKALKQLEKSGITILLRNSDPFINDDTLAKLFNIPNGFIRVMNFSNARAYEKYSDMSVENSPAYIVHNGNALGFVCAMNAADKIQETRKIYNVLTIFGCVLGFLIVAFLGFIDGYSQISPFSAAIFQIIWAAFIALVLKIKFSLS